MGSDKRFKVRMTEECGDGQKGKREGEGGEGAKFRCVRGANSGLVGRRGKWVLCLGAGSG